MRPGSFCYIPLLLVYPVVLGRGKKLFPEEVRIDLRLLEARAFPSGLVLIRYAPELSS